MLTNLVDAGIEEARRCFETFVVDVCGLSGDIVGSAELNIGLFEVGLDSDGLCLSSRTRTDMEQWSEGSVVRGGYRAQDLTSARIVKVNLVILLEGGELGSGLGDVEVEGNGGCHDELFRLCNPNPSLAVL